MYVIWTPKSSKVYTEQTGGRGNERTVFQRFRDHVLLARDWSLPPLPCISYANVHNYYGPYAYCSLDKGVACAQHIQLLTHTCAGHMC